MQMLHGGMAMRPSRRPTERQNGRTTERLNGRNGAGSGTDPLEKHGATFGSSQLEWLRLAILGTAVPGSRKRHVRKAKHDPAIRCRPLQRFIRTIEHDDLAVVLRQS